jgi:small-conductance mechanosensitive channel
LVFASIVVLVLILAFRSLEARLRKREPGAYGANLRAIESTVAAVVGIFIAVSVMGGFSNLLVSVGLLGFGLTLALQRPILSVAGWASIRFGRLFSEGDRIEVQGIVGDVLDISLFRTRLWEIGSEKSPLPWGGSVSPLRETGRLVTLSNATFVEHPVANATADTPVVFDEFPVSVAYEADWRLAESLLRGVAAQVINLEAHGRAAARYERLARGLPTVVDFPQEPTIIMMLRDSWIELRLRYLVDVRRRSATRTMLARKWQEATEANAAALPNVYPRVQSIRTGRDGRGTDPGPEETSRS